MRDNQRSAVYKWESSIRTRYPHLGDRLDLKECEELIHKVWNDYRPGDKPPRIKDGRGTRWARGGRWSINLPMWARTKSVVLHEIAHSLVPDSRHGKVFAQTLVNLLVRHGKYKSGNEKVNAKIARTLGIKQKPRRVRFAPSNACPKPVSPKFRRWSQELAILRQESKEIKQRIDEHFEIKPER